MADQQFDFDVLVIGSGFGGSVTALRLTEKGYRVGVLEAGARFEDQDFSKGTFDLTRYLWAPALGCYGIQRVDAVRDTLIVAGAGVGGGSLVYANTLYEPLPAFYQDPQWSHITDWREELAPYYDQAKRMLGVVENPVRTPADDVMEKVAADMGVGETFHPTPVGVFFGGPGQQPGEKVEDPFFGGEGPARNTCTNCGECMSGCRHNAKNTLVKNYLYLAEKNGATVLPLTTVTQIDPREGGGFDVRVKYTKAKRATAKNTRVLTAEHVVMAAASLGTQKLLHRMKDEGHLPRISDRLGHLSRTNSESILGAIAPKSNTTDYSYGVAITSSFHPDEHTHIEPCRYGKGHNAMALMQTVLTDGSLPGKRWQQWLKELWKQRTNVADLYDLKHWSERTVIALVMQSLDNSITTYGTKSKFLPWRMTSKQGHGSPNPTYIPEANEAVNKIAEHLGGGTPGGNIGEPFNMPLTAHFIGGCTIGDSPETGVIDPYQRVYGYPGLHVADGSAITANLGVNPSLTITAQAERAMSFWPNKGEADPRPELGAAYERISPVAPAKPAVPGAAPGALRLPIVGVS
ncbi:GMC oxidoreductase [Nocardioides sp.]|uniref:GMC oxidoreductase n=1 Tax=Nocardioides sp. TaxID=35761 RepID=UPI0035190FD1